MKLVLPRWLAAAFCSGLLAVSVQAAAPEDKPPTPVEAPWVAAWAVAPIDFQELASNPATAPAAPPGGNAFQKQTLRQQLQPTLGGERIRIRFSNRFGKTPMHIAAASVGRSTGGGAMSPATLRMLRFDGRGSLTLAPGAEAWSDGVALKVEAGQTLAVSAFFDSATPFATVHVPTAAGSWVAPGNAVAAPRLRGGTPLSLSHIVTGLDVETGHAVRVVVALGDSITAGGADAAEGAYPDMLATRLRDSPQAAQKVAVLNAGIGGNRLLADGIGPRALSRFANDALGQSGATHVIVLLGTNDIGRSVFIGLPGFAVAPAEVPTAERITAGLQQLVKQAHDKGVKVLLGTVPPFKNSPYWTEASEAMRSAVNRWIRSRQDVDGVIDFDAALRSPSDAQALNPLYDSGDHLHPSRAGHAAMAAAVDLRELQE
jgi:lysophospholipase L1-like esterase